MFAASAGQLSSMQAANQGLQAQLDDLTAAHAKAAARAAELAAALAGAEEARALAQAGLEEATCKVQRMTPLCPLLPPVASCTPACIIGPVRSRACFAMSTCACAAGQLTFAVLMHAHGQAARLQDELDAAAATPEDAVAASTVPWLPEVGSPPRRMPAMPDASPASQLDACPCMAFLLILCKAADLPRALTALHGVSCGQGALGEKVETLGAGQFGKVDKHRVAVKKVILLAPDLGADSPPGCMLPCNLHELLLCARRAQRLKPCVATRAPV